MAVSSWDSFTKIQEMAGDARNPETYTKVDAIVSAALEGISDMLPTATVGVLQDGVAAARAALEAYERLEGFDEASPSFVAGRLASAVDLLGFASYQTADENSAELARTQPYGRVLRALEEGPLRSVDLAKKLDKDPARTSKWLTTLREHGLVTSLRHGRELFSALTPLGRLLVDEGWQNERRAPLDTSNVVSLAASQFDMSSLAGPSDVKVSEVPRISASGSR